MGGPSRHLRRPDPELRTERVHLRAWTPDDVGALVAAWEDPEVARWTGVPEADDVAAFARRWVEQTPQLVERNLAIDLVVEHEGDVAGEVGLVHHAATSTTGGRVELGWWIAAEHRGKGLASEAVRCFADWVLAPEPEGLGVSVAYAVCADANPASGAVARAAGFAPCDRDAPAGSTTWTRSGDGVAPGRVDA